LLVACIPALLMLATFGLERLESALVRDPGNEAEVAEFLQQAALRDAPRPARNGAAPRPRERAEPAGTLPTRLAEVGLPTRVYTPQLANPQFQPTQHANRV
jgi:hypothetical protein